MFRSLKTPKGMVKKGRRLGRGVGSGRGKTSGKGHKGQNSRSGKGVSPLFEGGQMPIHRRLPKKGFNNFNTRKFVIVNLRDLNVFSDGETVNAETLKSRKLVKKNLPIKLLGDGELKVKRLRVEVNKASKSAVERVKSNGGEVIILGVKG